MAATRGRLEGRIRVPDEEWTATVGGSTATIPAGRYYASGFLDEVESAFAAAAATTCSVTASLGESGTGIVTITFGSAKAITWVDTALRDILGFTGNSGSATSHVGTQHLRFAWLPGCPYQSPNAVSDDWQGWRESDARSATNPSGYSWTQIGDEKVVNRLSWPSVKRSKTWIANEATVNASFERFVRDAIWGDSGWSSAGGPIRFYPDAGGSTYATYSVPTMANIRPVPLFDDWAGGPWRIDLPRLVVVPGVHGRVFPDTLGEWNAFFPTITDPTSIWSLQDMGSPAVDGVGSNNLTWSGSIGGISGLSEPYGRLSLGIQGSSQYARASVLDITTQDFTIFFRFLTSSAFGSNGRRLWRRKSVTSGTNGWFIEMNSSGNLEFEIDSPSASGTTVTLGFDHDDGQWHDAMVSVDRSGNAIVASDLGSTTGSVAAHVAGSLTNGANFGAGDTNANLNNPFRGYFCYCVFWDGYAATLAEFDQIRGAG